MKSARSKATDIPRAVKRAVFERDGCCIICGRAGAPNAHYISRQRGGLGIEENIVTLCTECHYAYDFGGAQKHREYGAIIKAYLRKHYKGWNEENLYYKKWSDLK